MYERPEFWKTRLDEVKTVMDTVRKGTVKVAAKSAGGRDVYLVEYGEKQNFGGTANYSSAMGAGSIKYYADKKGKKPVIYIIGAEHGDELEGTVAILNMIRMIETGKDFKGETIPYLRDCIENCRLLLIPIANPDGRARMEIDTLNRVPYEVFRHYAQGRWKDRSLCSWPMCKQVHPIKDHVSFLGAYFNDDGVNIVHDNFFGKMASETQAIFDIAIDEAPDFTLHLHGASCKNEIDCADYSPRVVKEIVQQLKHNVTAEADKHGLPTLLNKFREDDSNPPRTFNIMSALHHACGTVSMLYECNQGVLKPEGEEELEEWEAMLTCDEILWQLYILFEQTIRYAHELRGKGVM